jgi:hypothetical protein
MTFPEMCDAIIVASASRMEIPAPDKVALVLND